MLRPALTTLLSLALAAALSAQTETNDESARIADANAWQSREVGRDIVLRTRRFERLFNGPQSVTVLDLPARAPAQRFDVEAPGRLERTSSMAQRHGALAAINGGFFKKDAGAVGLLRLDGTLVSPATAGQASVGVDATGQLALAVRPAGDWPEVREALGVGVVLVQGGKVVDHGERQRQIRHPRSAIGTTKNERLLLITIDGRTDMAAGTSYEETAQLLRALGCEFAINLDGGGSSTLWVASRGVCNHPCDNKRFDHEGERAVANALLVFAPAVVVVDDDEAELHGAFASVQQGKGIHGADCAVAADDAARAVFAAKLPFAGRWSVRLWTPEVEGAGPLHVAVDGRDQRTSAAPITPPTGAWLDLGTLDLEAPRRVNVTLHGTGKPWVADAVQFAQAQ